MKNFFSICIVLLALSGNVYSQNWLWVKSQGINTANPLSGNTRLTASGNLVTFLAKPGGSHLQFIDGNGIVLWSQFFTNLTIFDVCTDVSDNIYFAGTYTTNTTIGSNNFVSQGGADALIGEFNSSGTLIKSKSFGTSSSEYAKSIALSNNQIYVTGSFINSQMVNGVALTGNGSSFNTYVLKFDMNFVAQNGIETVSSANCEGVEVGIDQTGAVYLLGISDYALSIGTQSTYITSAGTYFAKLSNNLSITWLQTLIVHGSNGWYKPFMYFDNSSNITLTHVTGGGGGADNHLMIEKYNPSGAQIWYKDVMVNEFDFVDQDNQDNIWVAGGYFYGAGPMNFSIVKINSTATSTTQLIWDVNIQHSVLGLAAKTNNDFYIIGNCDVGSNLNNYTCSPSSSVFMAHYGLGPTGIENKAASDNTFNIYPNPSTGIITISCNSGVKNGCTVIIKNVMGQLVYLDPMKETSGSFTKNVDLSMLPKGAYFVEIESDQERTTKQIIFH